MSDTINENDIINALDTDNDDLRSQLAACRRELSEAKEQLIEDWCARKELDEMLFGKTQELKKMTKERDEALSMLLMIQGR